ARRSSSSATKGTPARRWRDHGRALEDRRVAPGARDGDPGRAVEAACGGVLRGWCRMNESSNFDRMRAWAEGTLDAAERARFEGEMAADRELARRAQELRAIWAATAPARDVAASSRTSFEALMRLAESESTQSAGAEAVRPTGRESTRRGDVEPVRPTAVESMQAAGFDSVRPAMA